MSHAKSLSWSISVAAELLIGLTAPAALKGSLSQVKSRREDEHLAQLDLIQLDLSENSFLLARDHEESLYNSSCPAIKCQEDILGHLFHLFHAEQCSYIIHSKSKRLISNLVPRCFCRELQMVGWMMVHLIGLLSANAALL